MSPSSVTAPENRDALASLPGVLEIHVSLELIGPNSAAKVVCVPIRMAPENAAALAIWLQQSVTDPTAYPQLRGESIARRIEDVLEAGLRRAPRPANAA